MGKAGCWLISWGIESGNEEILKHAAQGRQIRSRRQASLTLGARRPASRTGATSSSACPARRSRRSSETIDFSKALPLDIALFHIAAPYPGTPFFFEVVENGWFRPGTHWEEVDMDESTVLDYPEPARRGARGTGRSAPSASGRCGRVRC